MTALEMEREAKTKPSQSFRRLKYAFNVLLSLIKLGPRTTTKKNLPQFLKNFGT